MIFCAAAVRVRVYIRDDVFTGRGEGSWPWSARFDRTETPYESQSSGIYIYICLPERRRRRRRSFPVGLSKTHSTKRRGKKRLSIFRVAPNIENVFGNINRLGNNGLLRQTKKRNHSLAVKRVKQHATDAFLYTCSRNRECDIAPPRIVA